MRRTVEEILALVGIDALARERYQRVSSSTPLSEVYRVLDDRRTGAVLVCDDDRLVGIFTDRDVLYRTAAESTDPDTPISELMSREPETLSAGHRVADAIEMMTTRGYRHIPLVDGEGRLTGLLTSRDILRFIADHFPEAVLNLPPRLHQQLNRPEGG